MAVIKPRSRDTLATRYLYKRAQDVGTVPTALRVDRDAARKTLAARRSPVSKPALQNSLGGLEGDSQFVRYSSAQDRHAMVGDVPMKEGRDNEFAGFAAVFERLAGGPAQIAGRTARTDAACAEAYPNAAEAYTRAHLPEQDKAARVASATDARVAAGAYGQGRLRERAAGAGLRAADAFPPGCAARAGHTGPPDRRMQLPRGRGGLQGNAAVPAGRSRLQENRA